MKYLIYVPLKIMIIGDNIILDIFQGAGHNDVELYNQYLERLKQFVSVELIN